MTFRRITRLFASWWLTGLLSLFMGAVYIFFTFGQSPYGKWMDFLFRTPAGLISYGALIVNLLMASVRVMYERLRMREITPDEIRIMDVHTEIPAHDRNALQKVAEGIRAHGFPAHIRGDSVSSARGRLSFLPGTVMRSGFVILMVSLLFSAYLRKSEEALLREGEGKVFFGEEVTLDSITSSLPEEFLQVGEDGAFTLEGVSALFSVSGKRFPVSAGFPSRIKGFHYRITNLGFSHFLSVRRASGNFEGMIDLNVLPPGKTDVLALPSTDQSLTFSLQPARTIRKGFLKGKQYNLLTPLYQVVVQRGKNKLPAIMISPGRSIYSGGDAISLGSRGLFLKVKSVYDPALPWVYAGLLVALAGMMLMVSRFFWYRKEFAATRRGHVMYVGYREEFYKKWGVQKFYRWSEDLSSMPEFPSD